MAGKIVLLLANLFWQLWSCLKQTQFLQHPYLLVAAILHKQTEKKSLIALDDRHKNCVIQGRVFCFLMRYEICINVKMLAVCFFFNTIKM